MNRTIPTKYTPPTPTPLGDLNHLQAAPGGLHYDGPNPVWKWR